MAKELKGLALGVAAGLGVVGLAYLSSAAVTHADSAPAQTAKDKPAKNKPAGKVPAAPAVPDPAKMVADGRTLYVANCVSCHGQDAEGKIGPGLHALGDPDARVYRHIANGFGQKMPAYKNILSAPEINSLVAYIQTLK